MDEEQRRSLRELLLDEGSAAEWRLVLHRSSVVESADCVPPYSCCSSRLSHKPPGKPLDRF